MDTPYIVALEIGSSKIVGGIASVSPEGLISVFALEEEQFRDSVRYGDIKNIDDTNNRVRKIIESLSERSQVKPQRITSVYVGLNAKSLRSVTRTASITIHDGETVTESQIRRMEEEVKQSTQIEGLEVIDVKRLKFTIDNIEIANPVGSVGSKLEGVFCVILGREQLRANLRRVIEDRNGLKIRKYFVTALAEGANVLSSNERRLGAMLVDFGAETTSVVIYHKDAPVYMFTLPIGSRNITRDITSLNVVEETAEDIKKSIGNAKETDNLTSLNISDIKAVDAGNLIMARAGEIVANISAQLTAAGLSVKDIPEGVVVTGGGSKMRNFVELISDSLGVKARHGEIVTPDFKTVDCSSTNPAYIALYSLLAEGAHSIPRGESCCTRPIIVPKEPENRTINDRYGQERNNNTPADDNARYMPGGYSPVSSTSSRKVDTTPVKEPQDSKPKTKVKKQSAFSKFWQKVQNATDHAFDDSDDDE